MMGKSNQLEPKLFYHGVSLDRRIPHNHPLRKIEQHINFNFIRSQVADLYGTRGQRSVDPTVILKLMFLLFYENIKSERALMQQLPLRLDWLWFCGYDLDDKTPNHSVLSKARRRWGLDVFTQFFENILLQCLKEGLVEGETIHVDSSMIDANASKDSLKAQIRLVGFGLYKELEKNTASEKKLSKRVSTTDSDARLGKKYGKTTLGYKDHRGVDDKHGIITATVTTPANVNDEKMLTEVIDTHQENTHTAVKTVVADKAYGIGENYKHLHEQGITPCISHPRTGSQCDPAFSHDQFKYDKATNGYLCPAGETLHQHQVKQHENRVVYKADRDTCQRCQHFEKCVTSKKSGRQIERNMNKEHIDWADNCLSSYERKRLMARRKHKAEGSFADATNHGFKRSRFRGIKKVQLQNLMIAATQNLRKLMRHIGRKSASQAFGIILREHLRVVLFSYSPFLPVKPFFNRTVSDY